MLTLLSRPRTRYWHESYWGWAPSCPTIQLHQSGICWMIARHDFMSHTQKPIVYGIGGLTILVHMSGTSHLHQDTHFREVLMNYVRQIKSALARVVALAEPWPSGAIADGKVARCVPNTTMSSNSDAKLVDAMQSGMGLVLFSSGKEFPEIQPNQIVKAFALLNPPKSGPVPQERSRTMWESYLIRSALTYANFRRTGKPLSKKDNSLHPVTRERSFG